jgi:Tol biopolymer transport system component
MSPIRPAPPHPRPQIPEAEVLEELERILASREFAGAGRLCRFLRFVVSRTLAGDRDGLKESVIGTEVFDRDPGYDPKVEPVVRTAAMRLRAKLDHYYEQPGRPWMVRISMPKGAYLAAFEPRPQPVALPSPDAAVPEQTSPWRRRAMAAAAIVAIAAAAYIATRSQPPRVQPVESTVTSYPGRQEQPALSPDGSQVAFVWQGESGNNRDIYITMASGGLPRRITTDPGADDFPAWSPDGSTIAFVRENRSLMLVTPLGTNERRLTSAFDARLSWTPDGKHIAFTDWMPDGGPLAVFVADAATGARRRVTAPGEARPGDVMAEISPNGREIIFVRADRTRFAAWRVPIDGGSPRLVGRPDHGAITGITWSPDARTIVFSAARGSVSLLWSVPASGGTSQLVAPTGEDNRSPSFARALPPRLVWEHSIRDSNIWRLDLSSHEAKRIVASTRLDSSPQLSPDGRSLLFVSDRTGSFQLWRAAADGADPVQLTKYSYEYPGSARWSPDGTKIAFDLRADAGRAIFVMDAAGGTARQWTPWREGSRPSWSRDGRWIYFGDRAPDNRFEIWEVSASAPGDPQRITHGGGTDPFDSPDGRTIYFVTGRGDLWSIPAAGGAAELVAPSGVYGGWFSVTSRGLFFADLYSGGAPGVSVPGSPKPIRLLPFGGGDALQVGKIEGGIARDTPDFTVSADGRTALFSIQEIATSQVRMLEGFR